MIREVEGQDVLYIVYIYIVYIEFLQGIGLLTSLFQFPTLTTVPILHMHVQMWSHFTFIILMAKLVRQINK
jgi:hypothetical protein